MSPLRVPRAEQVAVPPSVEKRFLASQVSRTVRLAMLCAIGGISMSLPQARAGLAYWGSEGFVENADSKDRAWTADFTMTLGVFKSGFTPTTANREEWAGQWIPLSTAAFSSAEARFAGVVDLSLPLPAGAARQVYFWASNGSDLTKGPEWLLLTRADWRWPASSEADAPALVWTTDVTAAPVLGAVGLNGRHLVSNRVAPVPTPRETWLASFFPGEPGKCRPDADPDGDGLSNHVEYLLGSNPADAGSRVCPEINRVAGDTLLTLKRNAYAESGFAVESSGDLRKWSATSGETLQDAPDLIQVRVPGKSAPAAAFFRFRLESTAQP